MTIDSRRTHELENDQISVLIALLKTHYDPTPPIRVGILSVAGALDEHAAGAVLEPAGHTVSRRFGQIHPRLGESDLRREDVLEFLDFYGHEYAIVAIRGWKGSVGAEAELTTQAIARNCQVIWVLTSGDSREAIETAGAIAVAGL